MSSRARGAGFGLIEMIIAMGVLVIGVAGVATMLKHMNSGNRHGELRNGLQSVKTVISNQLSCSLTVTPAVLTQCCAGVGCTPTKFFPLISNAGTTIGSWNAASGYTVIGDWAVRASCNGAGLVIQTARPLPTGQFAADPLNPNLVYNWNWKVGNGVGNPLFLPGEKDCGASFGTAANPCPAGYFSIGVSTTGAPLCNATMITAATVMAATDPCPAPAQPSSGSGFIGYHYFGTAVCPAGFSVIAGGFDCGAHGNTEAGGFPFTQGPSGGGTGWSVDCCTFYSASQGTPTSNPAGVWATCIQSQ